jgi:hypothetical protein
MTNPGQKRATSSWARAQRFFREYTEGLSSRDLKRLFERDAAEAYQFLTRDRGKAQEARPEERFWIGARDFFLGLSAKLSPARRVLFAASLVAALLGFFAFEITYEGRRLALSLDFSPLWFLLSIAGLVLVLALELVDRVRVKDELEVARELQDALLPARSPRVAGWALAHAYRTAAEVGGDYYHFAQLPDHRLALAIGDASGHGIAAALLMAVADTTLKTALDLSPEPPRVAALLNRSLYRIGGRRAFLSLFFGLLDLASGRLDYICAGHPYPLLRRGDGRLEELGEGGFPLGMRPRLSPPTGTVVLEPGDQLLLYTDGLVEGLDGEGRAFGFERLRALARGGGDAQAVLDAVLLAFDRHRGGQRLADDLTLIVLHREGDEPAEDLAGEPDLPPLPPLPPTPPAA